MSKMILVDEKTVKQAFEALDNDSNSDDAWHQKLDAKTALRQALEQPPADQLDRKACEELNHAEEVLDALSVDLNMEQTDFDCIGDYINAVFEAQAKKLASAPRQWVGLTDDAVYAAAEVAWRAGWAACRDAEYVGEEAEDEEWGYQGATIAQDTETKLREKNTRPQPAEPSSGSSSPKGPSI